MIVERFHFPGDLCFELESDDPGAVAFFQAEYGWAHGGANRRVDVALRWRRSTWPSPREEETAHVHKILARWCYTVTLSQGSVELQARGNRWALPMVHHMLVHPALRYLAAQRGLLFLHAAAVERGRLSVLFAGSGGVGKTTTSSLLLARGDDRWRYHADDYVIVDSAAGSSFAYPTRAHLYGDLLQWVPEVAERLTVAERLKVHFFGWLRRLTGEGITWPTRVELKRLWPKRELGRRAKVAAIFLLQRGDVDGPETAALSDREAAVQELLAMNFHEARNFVGLLDKAGVWQAHPNRLEGWKEQERDALRRLVAKVPCQRLILPVDPDRKKLFAELEAAMVAALEAEPTSV